MAHYSSTLTQLITSSSCEKKDILNPKMMKWLSSNCFADSADKILQDHDEIQATVPFARNSAP